MGTWNNQWGVIIWMLQEGKWVCRQKSGMVIVLWMIWKDRWVQISAIIMGNGLVLSGGIKQVLRRHAGLVDIPGRMGGGRCWWFWPCVVVFTHVGVEWVCGCSLWWGVVLLGQLLMYAMDKGREGLDSWMRWWIGIGIKIKVLIPMGFLDPIVLFSHVGANLGWSQSTFIGRVCSYLSWWGEWNSGHF